MVTTFLRLWILIKRPPFIYVIFNFIIVYILLSSTFSLHLKFYKRPKPSPSSSSSPNPQPKTKLKHVDFDDTTSYSLASSSLEGDRDTWWCQIVDDDDHGGEERETASLEQVPKGGGEKIVDDGSEERETALFELPKAAGEKIVDGGEEGIETASFQEVKRGVEEEQGGEGDDTLDATWEAIMEAKRKGSGPQLKKSDTWTAGNEKGRLGREKIAAELKKWQTFRGAIEERENSRGGGGWRRVEADHDELKKRADAFISRFTHDIRLQRLESDQRFLEMINRGI